MATILHINSSVRHQGSHSRSLTAEFLASWQAAHPSDRIIERDLASDPVPHLSEQMVGAFFTPEEQRTAVQSSTVQLSDVLVDELMAADILVLGAPMYNFSISSGLKAWIDHVVRAGRTFKYSAAGAAGLLGGRKVLVVTAAGGSYSEAPASAHDFVSNYLRTVLGFIGLTDITFVRAEGLAMGEAAMAEALAKSRAALHQLAAAA